MFLHTNGKTTQEQSSKIMKFATKSREIRTKTTLRDASFFLHC